MDNNNVSSPATNSFQADPYLRVKSEKVSQLLDLVGELGLVAASVTRHPALRDLELEGFQNDVHLLENLIRDIQGLASGMRLVPVGQLFRRMQRVVRDLLHETNKPIDLVLLGEDTEVDKFLVDQISDPLIHLIRNAVDHGIENPEERVQAGKLERGKITLKATQPGKEIHISVSDDGRGLDREAILRKARRNGLIGEHEQPDDATVWSYIFRAGFSTAAEVSTLSGRGVGMDVVQNSVRALRGRVLVNTQHGQGTCIILAIPLTLAFLDGLVVKAHHHLYTIPIEAINEVFKPSPTQWIHSSADGNDLVDWQGEMVPVRRLQNIYAEAEDGRSLEEQIVVVVATREGTYSFPVDEIVGQQQVVVKPLKGFLREIHGSAGCALLSTGEVAIVLDVNNLFNRKDGS